MKNTEWGIKWLDVLGSAILYRENREGLFLDDIYAKIWRKWEKNYVDMPNRWAFQIVISQVN